MGNLGVPWNQGFISETINNASKFSPYKSGILPISNPEFQGNNDSSGEKYLYS